jgi:sporulation-control protein
MVFKKLMQAMGVGGPEVEIVLHDPSTIPARSPAARSRGR